VLKYLRTGYDGEITIIGKVLEKNTLRYGRKQLFKVVFEDSEGSFDSIWFQGIKFFKNHFNEGEYYAISAKPVMSKYGHLQFTHPDFDRLDLEESTAFQNTGKIIPFYTIPKELKSTNIGDNSLRRILQYAVTNYSELVDETLPQSLIGTHSLLSLKDTISNIHFPESLELLQKARERLKYEEIFMLECFVALKRNNIKNIRKGYSFKIDSEKIKKFLSNLPFELTGSQLNVLSEIKKDMNDGTPMNRLLQGDVGSGKTIVALISMLIAIHNGYQAVLLVPTEILADQHYKNISTLLAKTGIKVALLLGGGKKKDKQQIMDGIQDNQFNLIIGTHALLEDNVEFNNVGIVIIDEQHRFGVAQRSKLIDKGISPDVLVMTATPIPRTLTMTVYGDLDVSVISEKPKNRKAIKTVIRSDEKLPEIYKYIVDKARERIQSYIVYPLVEESDKMDLKSAQEYFILLKDNEFSSLKVGMIHGRMTWQEKEEVMLQFANHNFDVLISTTVIEVGIDVPNANIIVINDAYRFGLSQLHQLRGRVGRSDKQAYCVLVTKNECIRKAAQLKMDFSYMSSSEIELNKSAIRLNAMSETNDGFKLSEIDLKLRGPGDIFGTKQSGFPMLQHVNLFEDYELIKTAKSDAFNLVNDDPSLSANDNLKIKAALKKSFRNHIYYSLVP